MTDTSHLVALSARLSNERARLRDAKTSGERELRAVWVAQIEREIAAETAFIADTDAIDAMSADELLAELEG